MLGFPASPPQVTANLYIVICAETLRDLLLRSCYLLSIMLLISACSDGGSYQSIEQTSKAKDDWLQKGYVLIVKKMIRDPYRSEFDLACANEYIEHKNSKTFARCKNAGLLMYPDEEEILTIHSRKCEWKEYENRFVCRKRKITRGLEDNWDQGKLIYFEVNADH